jgi:membrane protein implicated in regulation of membrane protease activity
LSLIKFVPGFIAAIVAFVALKVTALVGSLWLQILAFLGVYLFVAIFAEIAMTRYGQRQEQK